MLGALRVFALSGFSLGGLECLRLQGLGLWAEGDGG